MNDDQLEVCLRNVKSSSSEPDAIDGHLEERMMELFASTGRKRLRRKRLAAFLAILVVSGTGFVSLGGDSAVMNYISPSTEKDADGNPIPYEVNWGKWVHEVHDHLWEQFKRLHGM